ncbi:MAG TPA: hypothetical protein VMV52_07945 [Candidatus Nanopelagicaceae bacterium]|nr:hypothetical protein [Candidatus Nanopelagicaceae bacterium]
MDTLRYRVGLDFGTASVALVAVALDEIDSPDSGVYSRRDFQLFRTRN